MDVQKLMTEPIQVLVPPIIATLQLGMTAVQMKSEQRDSFHDGNEVLQLVSPAVRYVFQHDGTACGEASHRPRDGSVGSGDAWGGCGDASGDREMER